MTSTAINNLGDLQLFFKCDNFQKGGAYKARAATYNMVKLTEEEKQRGVCTQSSGNHGSCLARMAQQFKVKSYIVMPSNAAQIKIDATKSYDGNVILSGITQKEREQCLEEIKNKYNSILIHPYDNYRTITGAGTLSYEFINQQKDLDLILVPIGGGGLCSGTLIVCEHYKIRVIGVEPDLASDGLQSIRTGVIQEQMPVKTIADGLRTKLGLRTFPIIKEKIEDIWTVSEEEIISATLLIWTRMKILVETSAATVLAAALKNKDKLKGLKVGLLITGGNVDFEAIKQYL